MLEPPDLDPALIVECLCEQYRLNPVRLEFLPLGADTATAVYRAQDATDVYFVRLRCGAVDESSVLIPRRLFDAGVREVIPPLPNRHDALITPLDSFQLTLYPFIDGHSGFAQDLTAQHWRTLGRVLKRLHSMECPPEVQLARETFSAEWRVRVQDLLVRVEAVQTADPVADGLVELLQREAAVIQRLVDHAEALASDLRVRALPAVLCHADIHLGNILITVEDALYVVDWDTMILAPKERDLMFIGMGMASTAHISADAQTRLFYEGYGAASIDRSALTYYRCERIVQDIAIYCDQILLTEGPGADRQEGLRQLTPQFEPGAVVERALETDAHP